MAKDKEESLNIVSKNDYREDLEADVAYHVARIKATNPFRVTKKYTHIEIPQFDKADKRGRLDWEMQEIDRCQNGYDGLPGRFYYGFHHCQIKHKTRGRIRPDFRAAMLNFALTKERVRKTPGRGLVSVKRRQIGASWDFAIDNIYDCSFNTEFDIGMNSKGLLDGHALFFKHKYVHRNVSPFLRTFVNNDRRDAMIFSKWIEKEKKWKGTGSSIISVAPTPTGHAGNAYAKAIVDEAGEQPELMALWSNMEECLMDNDGVRVGTPYIFGTMGETTKAGSGLMEFWTKADAYNLERHGLWGYNCAIMDSLGNDNIEESVRSIIYNRKKREGLSKIVYEKYIQKWPLEEQDAFLITGGGGIGSKMLLSKQYLNLQANPPLAHKGWMRRNAGGDIDFIADEANGKIIIYERPQLISNGYVAACDPAEDDDVLKSRDNSNLGTAILAKPSELGPRLVAEYVDRPAKLHEYYEQLAMLLQWYNNTPCLVEMNKGGYRLKDYFEPKYPKLLQMTPKKFNSIKQGFELAWGIKKTPERQVQLFGIGDAYVENYWDTIPSTRLIEEFKVFGMDHADDDFAQAFLWALLLLQGNNRLAKNSEAEVAKNPNFHYQKIGGQLQLISHGNTVSPPSVKINNPLFNKRR